MILHQITRYAPQRFLNRSNLNNDVGAISVVADHFLQAADLALNSAKPLLVALLKFGIDGNGLVARTDCAPTFG